MPMSIKYIFIISTLIFFIGCANLKVDGDYKYVAAEQNSHINAVQLTYTNTIFENIPLTIRGKANHDSIHKDRPVYQETSIEYWFW